VEDPGESVDLVTQMPERFQRMLSAYERYSRDNNVLPVPAGYNHVRQLVLNTLHAGLREPFITLLLLLMALLPFYVAYCMKRSLQG
ncbi:MAG: arylsulfatase, partial [Halioglobus sp.]